MNGNHTERETLMHHAATQAHHNRTHSYAEDVVTGLSIIFGLTILIVGFVMWIHNER